jgi:hypothetical protein
VSVDGPFKPEQYSIDNDRIRKKKMRKYEFNFWKLKKGYTLHSL